MADLMNDPNVALDRDFGTKVFSAASWADLFDWLDALKSSMTSEHDEALQWAYPSYRSKNRALQVAESTPS